MTDPHTDADRPGLAARPGIFGYVCPLTDSKEREHWQARLQAWADLEGWSLEAVYEDPDPYILVGERPGLRALLDRLALDRQAVVVPSRDDLRIGDDWPALRTALSSSARLVVVLPELVEPARRGYRLAVKP